MERWSVAGIGRLRRSTHKKTISIVPYETVPFFLPFPAINCWATIATSLRDGAREHQGSLSV